MNSQVPVQSSVVSKYVNLTSIYSNKIDNEKLMNILEQEVIYFIFDYNTDVIKMTSKNFDKIKVILDDVCKT
jgi:hypothetical protein